MKILVPVFVVVGISIGAVQASRAPLSFFKPTQLEIARNALTGVTGADLNSDGRLDLITAAGWAGTLHVALSQGDGTFAPPASYTVGSGRGHLASADFNNDGALDIVFAGPSILVLLGNGDGTLQPPIVTNGSAGYGVAADFNGDGLQDLLSIGRNHPSGIAESIDVYPGAGDGTFGPPVMIYATDLSPAALTAADLNGDGLLDFAVGIRDARRLQIFLNTGAFSFTMAGSTFINVGPSRTLAGDVDRDGVVDLVTADFIGTITLHSGNGDGTLAAGRAFPLGDGGDCTSSSCPSPLWAELADLDGDAALDVVTANQGPGSATILLNDGVGGFGAPMSLGVRTFGYGVIVDDFDGDGAPDLAVTSGDAAFLDEGPRFVSTFVSKLRPPRRPRDR